MIESELVELLDALRRRRSEGQPVEVKRAQSALPSGLWETLSAFSNTGGGGVIILGVDEEDGFAVCGVDDTAKVQADLASLCDQMEPVLRPAIQMFELEGKVLLVSEISELPPAQKPCHYRPRGLLNGSYIRVGDGDRKLTHYEIQALLEARTQPRYDREPVGVSIDELDADLYAPLLRRAREQRRMKADAHWTDERLLRTLGVIVPDETGTFRPSLAGWLCFSPLPQEQFPNLCVTFVRHPTARQGEPGPGGERFIDNVKIEGPLPVMVVETLRVLKRHMQRRGIVHGLFREDLWEYPELVLREAIVNALGHRDLSPAARGAQVQIHMFPDRIEFVNPGGLFGPIALEELGEPGVQSARNETLMRILEDLPPPGETRTLCENRGSGLSSMLHVLRDAGMAPPSFDPTLVRFRVVVPNHTLYDEATLTSVQQLVDGRQVSENQRKALAYLHHVEHITNSDYCRLTGVDSRVATKDLADLVAVGLVHREGQRRWATYDLNRTKREAGATTPTIAVRRAARNAVQLERVVAELAARGPLSAQELADLLDVPRVTVNTWLRRLRADAKVEALSDKLHAPSMRYKVRTDRN